MIQLFRGLGILGLVEREAAAGRTGACELGVFGTAGVVSTWSPGAIVCAGGVAI
jgi:hypothetical protein